MKNVLNISQAGQDLLYSTDDGTNTLFINGTQVPPSSWVGSGTYTATISGHEITIAKLASIKGNVLLTQTGDYTYEFRQHEQAEPVTGVKGNAESTYRTGDVNLTAANIGANQKVTGMSADGETKTIASGTTAVDLLTEGISIPANHRCLLIYMVQWSANATGRRFAGVYLGDTSFGIIAQDHREAMSAGVTINRAECWFGAGSERTYMIRGFQNSGGDLTATVRYQLIDFGS